MSNHKLPDIPLPPGWAWGKWWKGEDPPSGHGDDFELVEVPEGPFTAYAYWTSASEKLRVKPRGLGRRFYTLAKEISAEEAAAIAAQRVLLGELW